MPPRAHRILSPLPLFDEPSLLAACVNGTDQPIPVLHAAKLWKVLLRQELETYHPDYIERMHSRMGSRIGSRAPSRTTSRRGSIGSSGSEEKDESKQDEFKSDEPPSTSPSNQSSATTTIAEGADENEEEESEESRQKRFEFERLIRQKLEAEDDAELAGLSVFPRSRFNPTEDELADESNPLHTKPIEPGSIEGLPQRMYPLLSEKFSYLTSRLQSHKTSADGSTTKLLIRLQDGQHIESVIMRHKQKDVATGNVEQRITLCVSSQVGCAMGCTFCSTGTMGMRGNLLMGEILEQLIIANRFEKIRNIVFMGMVHLEANTRGEPLKNYEQVLAAIRAMTDGNRFGLAPSRITLSTVGVIPKMLELTRDIPSIQLALSLHAPTQELRQQIVPTAKAYPIEKLIEAMDYFIQRSKKRILVEYVLLDGVNASEKEAHELGQLLKGKDVMINLIPYNSTTVAANYRAPDRADSLKFQSILTDQYHLFTTIRVEMGADINGACGQLALENQNLSIKPRGLMDDTATVDSSCSSTSSHSHDIEDLGRTNATKKSTATIKRRTTTATTSSTGASLSSASSSPSSSTCCSNDPANSCDCEESTASSSTATITATAPNPADSSSDLIDDEELTIGELLRRQGIKHYAEVQTDATSISTNAPSTTPFISPSEQRILTAKRDMRLTWRTDDLLLQLAIGMIILLGVIGYHLFIRAV